MMVGKYTLRCFFWVGVLDVVQAFKDPIHESEDAEDAETTAAIQ